MSHSMCYSRYINGVRNGAISIAHWGLLSDCYKVNPIGQWGKILVIVMGFIDKYVGAVLNYGFYKYLVRIFI